MDSVASGQLFFGKLFKQIFYKRSFPEICAFSHPTMTKVNDSPAPGTLPRETDLVDPRYISIKGARVNNLRNVDLQIPKNKLVVVTGVSGSGKSSITMDTLYAEGQRR